MLSNSNSQSIKNRERHAFTDLANDISNLMKLANEAEESALRCAEESNILCTLVQEGLRMSSCADGKILDTQKIILEKDQQINCLEAELEKLRTEINILKMNRSLHGEETKFLADMYHDEDNNDDDITIIDDLNGFNKVINNVKDVSETCVRNEDETETDATSNEKHFWNNNEQGEKGDACVGSSESMFDTYLDKFHRLKSVKNENLGIYESENKNENESDVGELIYEIELIDMIGTEHLSIYTIEINHTETHSIEDCVDQLDQKIEFRQMIDD